MYSDYITIHINVTDACEQIATCALRKIFIKHNACSTSSLFTIQVSISWQIIL